jgi:hypothetical protein
MAHEVEQTKEQLFSGRKNSTADLIGRTKSLERSKLHYDPLPFKRHPEMTDFTETCFFWRHDCEIRNALDNQFRDVSRAQYELCLALACA